MKFFKYSPKGISISCVCFGHLHLLQGIMELDKLSPYISTLYIRPGSTFSSLTVSQYILLYVRSTNCRKHAQLYNAHLQLTLNMPNLDLGIGVVCGPSLAL